MKVGEIAQKCGAAPFQGRRRMIALVGGPASGKSTLAGELETLLPHACVVPMDGFHLDNAVLDAQGSRDRKGAPHTFDAAGFVHLMDRIKREESVAFPKFDRTLDKSIAGADVLEADTETVIVEGNYLLLDQPIWRDLSRVWDVSVALNVPRDVLEARLVARWESYGYSRDAAVAKAQLNDLPNADYVRAYSRAADFVVDHF